MKPCLWLCITKVWLCLYQGVNLWSLNKFFLDSFYINFLSFGIFFYDFCENINFWFSEFADMTSVVMICKYLTATLFYVIPVIHILWTWDTFIIYLSFTTTPFSTPSILINIFLSKEGISDFQFVASSKSSVCVINIELSNI